MTKFSISPFAIQAQSLAIIGLCWLLSGSFCAERASALDDTSDKASAGPSYIREVVPVLRKYCGGCHNAADKEGDFSVASFETVMTGTPDGAVVVAKAPNESRLLKLMSGTEMPKMPPEDEAQPTAAEIELIKRWIVAGAQSDATSVPLPEQIQVPKLAADPKGKSYITAMVDAGHGQLAVGRFGKIEFIDSKSQELVGALADLPGKVNQLRLSPDGRFVLASTGIAGVGGLVLVVDVEKREVVAKLQGHSDAIYCASMSADGHWVATGSYDRSVLLWDWRKQTIVRKFSGHNGAIYDVDIDPSSKVLASASADQTIKLWGLSSGTRLDTFGQPEGEMLCVRFTPDGQSVIGSGSDRQLRMWQLKSKDKPAINPLKLSRFAHEEPVTQIIFADDRTLLSLSEDRTVKAWTLPDLRPIGLVAKAIDIPTGVAVVQRDSVERGSRVIVADYSGQLKPADVPKAASSQTDSAAVKTAAQASVPTASEALAALKPAAPADATIAVDTMPEQEPNQSVSQATPIKLPLKITGAIGAPKSGVADEDLFAFDAVAGEPWIIEVVAARNKSPLDSCVDILDSNGQLVLRTRLQAVRESYFTFRGKDSSTSDDFRMHKWQEMELNEYLYASGEVVKLWLYPRGPDSGFKVYPGVGSRATFFDTTPTTHALGEPAYIVRELAASEEPLPNGLPIFPVYFQNDDDSERQWGKDSRLNFVAPRDGRYFLRIRDARDFGGDDFKYEVSVRRPRPDFELDLKGLDIAMPKGSGREWQVTAKRLDGLSGPIEIHLEGLPEGFEATNPLVIQAGQSAAFGNIYATADAKLPEGKDKVTIKLIARSQSWAGAIERVQEKSMTLSLVDTPEVQIKLVENNTERRELHEIVIQPGETVSALAVVSRNDFRGSIALGKDDAGRNLPHGSFVDNIGLNGLLITEENSEREFFITAAPWLEPQERLFHLKSETKGNPTSKSILLRVVPSAEPRLLTGAN